MVVAAPDRPAPIVVQALERYRQRYLESGTLALRTRRKYRNDLEGVVAFLTDRCGLASTRRVTRVHLDAKGYSGAAGCPAVRLDPLALPFQVDLAREIREQEGARA